MCYKLRCHMSYCTEYVKFSIYYLSFIEVVSKMEDLLSQCSPNVEEYLTRLTKWLVVIRSK